MGLCYGKPGCRSSTVRHQSPDKRPRRPFKVVSASKHQTGCSSSPGGSFRRCTFQELLSREDGVPAPEVTKQRTWPAPNGGSCSSSIESHPDSCESFQGETTTSTFTSLEENDHYSRTPVVADLEEVQSSSSCEVIAETSSERAWLQEVACSETTSCSTEVDADSLDELLGFEVNFVDFLCVHSQIQATGTGSTWEEINSCKKRPSKSDSNGFSGSSSAKRPKLSSHEPQEARAATVLVRPKEEPLVIEEERLSESLQRISMSSLPLVKADESEPSTIEQEHRLSLSSLLVKAEPEAYELECLMKEYRSARAMSILMRTRSSATGSLSSTPFASAGSSFSSGFRTPPSASFASNASTPRIASSHLSIEEMAAIWGVFTGQ